MAHRTFPLRRLETLFTSQHPPQISILVLEKRGHKGHNIIPSSSSFFLSFFLSSKRPRRDNLAMWGVPVCAQDVNVLFEGYIAGDVQKLPWSEQPLEQESTVIKKNLRLLNRHGFLTINRCVCRCAFRRIPRIGHSVYTTVSSYSVYTTVYNSVQQCRIVLSSYFTYFLLSPFTCSIHKYVYRSDWYQQPACRERRPLL